ncbi:Uncharacterised protein [Mycobacteroides abscessus subsp. abscessus]|nr:Uncharacterised protein [Mycobacteroides abscessus subsp. abscessus]
MIKWPNSNLMIRVGENNVGFCDTFKAFAHDYRQVSEEDSEKMISMLYGDHGSCGYEYY